MRMGSSITSPSLETSPVLLVFNMATREFLAMSNPEQQIPPEHGQRPAAVKALAKEGVDTLVVPRGAVRPESYELALRHGMQFALWEQDGGPDTAMVSLSKTAVVPNLPAAYYADTAWGESEA